jgi:hypothetical protein
MSTMTDVDRARRAAQFANANRRNTFEVCVEAIERAQDALKHGEVKLVERELEYVREKLEKVA